jgi:predicted tellurium resistance membrane protein TerC
LSAFRGRRVQAASLRLFGAFGAIVLRSAAAFAVAWLPALAADLAGRARPGAVVAFLSRRT